MSSLDIADHLHVRRCRDGIMMFNPKDRYIGRALEVYGEFSYAEAIVFDQIVRRGDTVLDIGANMGAHTLHLSRGVGLQGRVLAFEPQRGVFQLMCANMALNIVTNVEPHWAAVGSRSGQIIVPRLDITSTNNFGALRLGQAEKGDVVRMVAIDELELAACSMIKMDIEGMEYEALQGASDTLKRLKPILYIENDGDDRSPDLINLILSLDYRIWWHLPAYFNPNNYNGVAGNLFPRELSVNMLCIHKSVNAEVSNSEPVLDANDTWIRANKDFRDKTGLPVHLRPKIQILLK